ncbi:MAG TPA: GNAT family N-acetyltransferase [Solirubrobacterales bacterium]|jgi:RimJ/RimL family protein N-acetyltransferase|nr:GNAT family N-acetyltransferase [Solirubrobacterales bacterium]
MADFTDRELRTERLLLRRYREDDLDRLAAIHALPEVARYLYLGPRSRKEAELALVERIASMRLDQDDDAVTLAVERREDGLLLGDATLFLRSVAHRQVEVGYVFHPDAGGHGYATEATRALVDFAFTHLDAHRVFARTDARNTASAALLRRLGMRQEAHFREAEIIKGDWSNELVFAILADEWRNPAS